MTHTKFFLRNSGFSLISPLMIFVILNLCSGLVLDNHKKSIGHFQYLLSVILSLAYFLFLKYFINAYSKSYFAEGVLKNQRAQMAWLCWSTFVYSRIKGSYALVSMISVQELSSCNGELGQCLILVIYMSNVRLFRLSVILKRFHWETTCLDIF